MVADLWLDLFGTDPVIHGLAGGIVIALIAGTVVMLYLDISLA